jgi:hypothetical protein
MVLKQTKRDRGIETKFSLASLLLPLPPPPPPLLLQQLLPTGQQQTYKMPPRPVDASAPALICLRISAAAHP